jgi:DNA helicase IV
MIERREDIVPNKSQNVTEHNDQRLSGELRAEQDYLDYARRCLTAMREAVERLKPHAADPIAREALEARMYQRLVSLRDDDNVPLFFGRIDFDQDGDVYHIGRRHVRNPDGDPVVVDWRAEISRPFYQASKRDPQGVFRRRRFGFRGGRITGIEDELLGLGQQAEGLSPVVLAEIERPRTGPMRDIVASIQPEQDEIVRAELDDTVCIQGAAGTGKTAVGLHRAAYLLYAYTSQLRRNGVLVVGPNPAFMRYISEVLPALGEVDVEQLSLPELLGAVPDARLENEQTAAVKHDPRMAQVIGRYIESRLGPVVDPLVLRVGSRMLRVEARELARIRERVVRPDLPYGAGRKMFQDLVIQLVLERGQRVGASIGRGDVTKAIRQSKPARDAFDAVWPKLEATEVVATLLSDEQALTASAAGLLTDAERRLLLREGANGAHSGWSAADRALIDEAAGAIARPQRYGHVVVDEAQDLSAMQLRAIGRRCQRSATLLGDLAQATTPWSLQRWEQALPHLEVRRARVETLSEAFRIPASVLKLANRLLRHIDPSLPPSVAVRDTSDSLNVLRAAPQQLASEAARQVKAVLERPGSIGVMAPRDQLHGLQRALDDQGISWSRLDPAADGQRVTLLAVKEAKGLEYDVVVLVEPAGIAGQPRGLRLLYIAMTRAVSKLVMVHAAPLPEQLLG